MSSRSSRSPRFNPRLESLDRRLCPSVTVVANGPELRVDGNGAADAVQITHNGNGNVSVTADGRTTAFTGITQIRVQTGGGDDRVTYEFAGATAAETRVRIDLGEGNDTATLTAAGAFGARAEVEVNGGRGNDTVTANYDVTVADEFRFRLTGGDGNDTVFGTLDLNQSTGDVEAVVKGNEGDDRLQLLVTGTAGSLDARLSGDAGFDRCASTPNVRVDECEAPL